MAKPRKSTKEPFQGKVRGRGEPKVAVSQTCAATFGSGNIVGDLLALAFIALGAVINPPTTPT